jgi:DNA-binding response OmpR family regulator
MPNKNNILWIDDEIEYLKPHIMLLEQKGYGVSTATNGDDAIELVKSNHFDLIFLDEMMVGMTGLETLPKLKEIDSATPIVMVTKSEAESLMDQAIGSKIDDYLTKPVNPAQILLACKKFIEAGKIESNKFTQDYMQGFNEITRKLMFGSLDWDDWVEIYTKLTKYAVELDKIENQELKQSLQSQFKEANAGFSKFVEQNYEDWLDAPKGEELPVLSPHILDKYLLPTLKESKGPVFFFVVDCMRYDQWLVFEDILKQYYTFQTEFYSSILPTATPYCRNSIFAGLYPTEIKKHYPQYWNVEYNSEETTQNKYEKELLEAWVERKRIKLNSKIGFIKIFDTDFGKKIEKEILQYANNSLTTIVINAVDMMAHSRSDYAILKEIAPDESAYRSLTRSWFQHSSLLGMLKQIATVPNAQVILTTDHGAVRCLHGVKVLGDRDTSTSLRYKFGKNVKAEAKHSMQLNNPEQIKIPKDGGITVSNIIAKEDYYFVYPTDYHHYLSKYRDSFQHGGISLEEMVIPVVRLNKR